MNETEYRKIKAVRNSGLGTIIQKSPAHYLHELRQPEKTTDATAFGTYLHALVLTPEIVENEYFVLDESLRPFPEKDYLTKANRQWRRDQIAAATNEGKTLVGLEDHRRAVECKNAIRKCALANEVMNSVGVHERLVQWTDLETGVLCKARIDKTRNADRIVDLKSCRDASKREFMRSVINYGYHRQAAFYLDGSIAKTFTFVAVESTAPYGVAVYDLSPEFIEIGRVAYQSALRQIKICREKYGSEFDENTVWPSYEHYYPISEVLSPPSWAVSHDFGD